MKTDTKHSVQGPANSPAGAYAWLRLFVGLALVVFFMFVIAPLGDRLPGFDSMFRSIEQKNIKATALYYTDIDEFADAAVSMRNSLTYPPQETVKD